MAKMITFHLDIIILVRGFYLLSAGIILVVRLLPPLRDRFLVYGARESQHATHDASKGLIARTLDYLATFKMPHSTFWHFYSLSLACTGFWMSQISQGDLLSIFEHYIPPPSVDRTTSPAKIGLCIFLFWLQGLRRLRECISLAKDQPSKSSMWIGHYFIGMAFYFVTNIAIFIEHVHVLLSMDRFTNLFLQLHRGPTLLEAVAFFAFVFASKQQHGYHVYLSGLVKYTLPDQGTFRYVVAPHYMAECAIYLLLAVLTAPAGQHVNITIFCAFIFVAVNLGITADGTKKWMLGKFPDSQKDIQKRWKMIPGIF